MGATDHQSHQAAIATDDDRCSEVGMDILNAGGNAVDAAVAVALCLGVVNPASCGIGGGGFMLLRLAANGEAHAYDMRETAPNYAHQDMYEKFPHLKVTGALSIAVPGLLRGLYDSWKIHGSKKLEWKKLVLPAIVLAQDGFEISPFVYLQMLEVKDEILADIGLREIFCKHGALLKPGTICHNRRLAETLTWIAEHDADIFYKGHIGRKLVKDVEEAGGILTNKDLEEYEMIAREPLSANIWGHQILGMPPPSSGGAGMALVLNILSQYGDATSVSDPLHLHRFIEALKHMFAARLKLGDPKFIKMDKIVSHMMSPKFAKQLKKKIVDNKTFEPHYYGGRYKQAQNHGTSHFSIIDKEGNALAMTVSLNFHFGARMLSPETGIILNNQMDDFSATGDQQAPNNRIRPQKRPLSSMSPTIIVKDGILKAVIGGSGGLKIIPTVIAVLLNYLSGKMDPLPSVSAPRCYHHLTPNVLEFESMTTISGERIELPLETREALEKKGHVLKSVNSVITGALCQLIHTDTNLAVVSDPRKGQFPSAYYDFQRVIEKYLVENEKEIEDDDICSTKIEHDGLCSTKIEHDSIYSTNIELDNLCSMKIKNDDLGSMKIEHDTLRSMKKKYFGDIMKAYSIKNEKTIKDEEASS